MVGLIAGWLAGKVMKGGGFGVPMDIVIGMVGAIIGGWVCRLLGIFPGGGLIGSVLVAFIGAVILLWLVRMIKRASIQVYRMNRIFTAHTCSYRPAAMALF